MTDTPTQLKDKMPKQLFIVSMNIEAMVLADDASHAKTIAKNERALYHVITQADASEYDASVATYLSCGYEPDELVYHDGPRDITVKEACAIAGSDICGKGA